MKPHETQPAPYDAAPAFWRSLEERRHSADVRVRKDEFPVDASEWPSDLSRRKFIEVMGASLALASFSGCGRAPAKQIVPYVAQAEQLVPGRAQYFATAVPWQGFARGVLAESHLGRPTKLEGNPDHPESLGATDAITQAAVLDLYDPDRSRTPRFNHTPAAWEQFEGEWLGVHRDLVANRGAHLALLTEPTSSPTLLRCIHRMLDTFPEARWYQHIALPRFDRSGRQHDFDPGALDVIVSFGHDFLSAHPASLRYAREFAARRRVTGSEQAPSRLYVVEPTPTITGSMADHRLAASPVRLLRIISALATELGFVEASTEYGGALNPAEQEFVNRVADDWKSRPNNSVCLAGPEMDDAVHELVAMINSRTPAGGAPLRSQTPVRSDGDPRAAGMLGDLVLALAENSVSTLLIFGVNAAYSTPADVPFVHALERASFTLHVGMHVDETAVLCRWHLPESHFLESWSDLRAFDGTATIVQPLIAPLFQTRTIAEILNFCSDPPGQSDYDLVRATWMAIHGADDFENVWNHWLRKGVVANTAPAIQAEAKFPAPSPKSAPADTKADGFILFRSDANVLDGRNANNAWLQELPRPISHLVWDNAALVSPAFAERHHLANGDEVTLESDHRSLDAPVWIQPGQADDCVTLHLGYGRTNAGAVGNGAGCNAYRLRTQAAPWNAPLTAIRRTGRTYPLVSTQEHFAMESRDLVRVVTVSEASRQSGETTEQKRATLFPDWTNPRYAWAMVIDLSTCIGCNACTIACQAENNIPTVGKDQVARGREMHWIRVDRYYGGDPENPRFVHQPVPCMQCETAPCELVCPVHATVHSSEGLNDMVYNRCIGTRYCSNNCPYKVRRFNFFDFEVPDDSLLALQKNPDVTVRARGVMEKCTYCVQRINVARIEASKERRTIRDGEVRTACQQVCPTEAIVFGDLHTNGSRVSVLRAHPLNYSLLPELNTRPRTTYLARVINPVGLPL